MPLLLNCANIELGNDCTKKQLKGEKMHAVKHISY